MPQRCSKRRNLFADDEGASYHLGFTLILPFYVLLIACAIELALMLNAKIAVTHAVYAAARAATVWYPADELPMEKRLGMIHLAAVNALAPIASGSQNHQLPASSYFRSPTGAAQAWVDAYRRVANGKQNSTYLVRKWRYAAHASRVRVEAASTEFNAPLTITIEYEHPFHTSGASWVFGRRSSWLNSRFRTQTIRATVTLENEGVRPPGEDDRNSHSNLGIRIVADHGFTSRSF